MLSIATQTSLLPQTKYFGTAQVLEFSETDKLVLLRFAMIEATGSSVTAHDRNPCGDRSI